MIHAWRTVFSGERIYNHVERWAPGVEAIEVTRFDRNTEWCGPTCGGSSWWDFIFGIQRVNFRLEMVMTQVGDFPPCSSWGTWKSGCGRQATLSLCAG